MNKDMIIELLKQMPDDVVEVHVTVLKSIEDRNRTGVDYTHSSPVKVQSIELNGDKIIFHGGKL